MTVPTLLRSLPLLLLWPLLACQTAPAQTPWRLVREGWSFDRDNIRWSDPKKVEEKKQKGLLNELTGWAEYDFEVPEDGWYELVFRGGVPGWDRDDFLDGQRLLRAATSGKEDQLAKDLFKECNLYLSAGKHSLRIRRLSFPGVLPSGWELTASGNRPEACVFAAIRGPSVLRAGETLRVEVSGGSSVPMQYDLFSRDLRSGAESPVGSAAFAGPGRETRVLELPVAAEGAYTLVAKVNGKTLRPSEFRAGPYVVVNTRAKPAAAAVKQTLLHEIDCVAQTDNGKPVLLGESYWEAWGATRIGRCRDGKYREGGDNLDPDIPLPPNSHAGKMKSGFSYAIDVPEAQQPYLLQVDYPDDDRRTANVIILEDAKTAKGLQYPAEQLGSGYETGDHYALSGGLLTHQVLFWASTPKLRVALVSMNPGMRAAAARIRVYRLEGGIPMAPPARPDGRLMAAWTEEPGRWLAYFRSFDQKPEIVADLIGIERYCQMLRYAGYNAVMPTEAVYQGTTYHSDQLEGWFVKGYDCPRIMALMCEKYGLRYIPELHLSGQAWFHREVVEKLVADPSELYVYSRLGTSGRAGNWFCGTWNPLHPAIQQKYLDIVGELADKVGDSPAFAGFSSRLMSWVWQSWNGLPSLNWGYGDWTIAQFEKDTGVKVPGAAGDPERFAQRFAFLTAAAQREKWLAWRCARMTDFYRRLRDRLRQANPQAVLYLPYYGDAEQGMDLIFGSFSQTPDGALREIGIDLAALRREPGIALMPQAGFGRRNSSPVADAKSVQDEYVDSVHKGLGAGRERTFGYGNAYFEVHTAVPIDKLGFPNLEPGAYCGAAEAAGRASVQKFSVVLADQDSNLLRIGGLGYTFGQPQYYREWLAAYENLPALPFTRRPEASDPVALWEGEAPDGFYFYAVNRENAANGLALRLEPAAARAVDLASGQALDANPRILLEGCQLRAFRAPKGTRIAAVQAGRDFAPADAGQAARWQQARQLLAEAQQIGTAIAGGSRRQDVTAAQRQAFAAHLENAWRALERGQRWQAVAELSTSPMIAVYEQLAAWPQGLLERRQPLAVLRTAPTGGSAIAATPMLEAPALKEALTAGSAGELRPGTEYDPEWTFTQVLRGRDRAALTLDVPAPGRYRLSLGHVAAEPGAIQATLGGKALAGLAETKVANRPDTTVFPLVQLPAGKAVLELSRRGDFGVYGVTLQPEYRPLPSPLWATIGPFPTDWGSGRKGEFVKAALERVDPPMQGFDPQAEYAGADGRKVRWQLSNEVRGGVPHFTPEAGVSFLFRASVQERQVCYALTQIDSPDDRDAELLIGCDWWAAAWLNGQPVASQRPAKLVAEDGAAFNGWRPTLARIHLRQGRNLLLVKSHGGTVANWFTAWVSDPGDLKVSAPSLSP